MKRLTRAEIETMLKERDDAITASFAGNPNAWQPVSDRNATTPARIEIPLGELTNANIRGFVWAWSMTHKVQMEELKSSDAFNANGLEGKATIPTDLGIALLVWQELPPYRCNINA